MGWCADCPQLKEGGNLGTGYQLQTESANVVRAATADAEGASWSVRRLGLEDARLVCSDARHTEVGADFLVFLDLVGSPEERDPRSAEASAVGPLRVEVTDVCSERGAMGSEVSVRFTDLPADRARDLATLLLDCMARNLTQAEPSPPASMEHIGDPRRARLIVSGLVGLGHRGWLTTPNGTIYAARSVGFSVRQPRQLVLAVVETPHGRPVLRGLPDQEPLTVELESYCSLYRFSVTHFEVNDDNLCFEPPRELVRIRRRRSPRVPPPDGLTVCFRHPRWPEVQIDRAVSDLSWAGLGFGMDLANDMLYPGLEVPDIAIRLNGQPWARVSGQVTHVSTAAGELPCTCGLRITGDDDALANWRETLESVLFPTTQRHAVWIDDIWQTYETSGYFGLSDKSGPHFQPLRAAFEHVSRTYDTEPGCGCHVVWPSARGAEVTASLLKIYQGTWMGHQLARRPGEIPDRTYPPQILRDLYLHIWQHATADPDLEWFVAYLEGDHSWHRMVHVAFAREYLDRGAFLRPFSLYEGDISGILSPPKPAGLEIGDATPAETERFLRLIGDEFKAPYVQALDLVRDRFSFDALNAKLSPAGLRRERSLRIARLQGSPVAASLLETGTPGTNLFRLLDGMRLFPFVPCSDSILSALIADAATWYDARGREVFVYYSERGDSTHAERVGLRDLGLGTLWIISARLLPDFLDHVYTLTAPATRL